MRNVVVWCAAAAVVLLSSWPSLAMDPSVRCQVDKLKISSKYIACRLKSEAKAAKRFRAPEMDDCDAAFYAAWNAAEERSLARGIACFTTGDAAAVQASLAAYCDSLAHGLSQDAGQK